jgi:hypothetical protein
LQRNELVHVTPRTPLFAPLRHNLPLQGFAGVRVFVTGYPVDVRPTISTLVQLLGGTVCDKLVRNNLATHLVLPRWGPDEPLGAAAAGDVAATAAACGIAETTLRKILFAQRHGVQMVRSEWLVECAHDGRKLQEVHFRPLGELELLPAGAAGGTQGTQAFGQTQIGGATQVRCVEAGKTVLYAVGGKTVLYAVGGKTVPYAVGADSAVWSMRTALHACMGLQP